MEVILAVWSMIRGGMEECALHVLVLGVVERGGENAGGMWLVIASGSECEVQVEWGMRIGVRESQLYSVSNY